MVNGLIMFFLLLAVANTVIELGLSLYEKKNESGEEEKNEKE